MASTSPSFSIQRTVPVPAMSTLRKTVRSRSSSRLVRSHPLAHAERGAPPRRRGRPPRRRSARAGRRSARPAAARSRRRRRCRSPPGTTSDSAMSTSSGTLAISTTVGMNCTTVNGVPSNPISRRMVQTRIRKSDQKNELERPEPAPDQLAERGAALDRPAAEHGAGAGGVVVRGQDHDAGLVAALLRGDVLRRAPTGQAADEEERAGQVAERRDGREQDERRADDGRVHRQDAADDPEQRVDRVRDRVVRVDAGGLDVGVAAERRRAVPRGVRRRGVPRPCPASAPRTRRAPRSPASHRPPCRTASSPDCAVRVPTDLHPTCRRSPWI